MKLPRSESLNDDETYINTHSIDHHYLFSWFYKLNPVLLYFLLFVGQASLVFIIYYFINHCCCSSRILQHDDVEVGEVSDERIPEDTVNKSLPSYEEFLKHKEFYPLYCSGKAPFCVENEVDTNYKLPTYIESID